jgi:hypothetical protein
VPQNIPNGRKMYQMAAKYTKWPQNIPNCRQIGQMAPKINQHLPLKDPTKFTQIWIFVFKIYHLATLLGYPSHLNEYFS